MVGPLERFAALSENKPLDTQQSASVLDKFAALAMPVAQEFQPGEDITPERVEEVTASNVALSRFKTAQDRERAKARSIELLGGEGALATRRRSATAVGTFFDRIIKGGFTAELRQRGIPLLDERGPLGRFGPLSIPIPGLTSQEEASKFERIKAAMEAEKGAPLSNLETLDARVAAQETRKLPFGVQGLLQELPFAPLDIIGLGGPVRGGIGLTRGLTKEIPNLLRRSVGRPPIIRPTKITSEAILGDLPEFGAMVTAMTEPNTMRRLGNLLESSLQRIPGLGEEAAAVLKAGNPAAFANRVDLQWAIGRAASQVQGEQQLKALFSLWTELSPNAESVFGKVVVETGRIGKGKYAGEIMDNLFINPSRFKDMTAAERLFVRRSNRAQREITNFLDRNGLDVDRLPLAPGENFVSRGVYGVVNKDGELVELARFPWGKGRGAGKPGFLKERRFDTVEQAIEAGYRYVPIDVRIASNARAAVAAVTEKNAANWLLARIPYRTTAVPEKILLGAHKAKAVDLTAQKFVQAVKNMATGGRPSPATIKAIRQAFPEAGRILGRVAEMTVGDLNSIISGLSKEGKIFSKVTPKAFRETLEGLAGGALKTNEPVPRGLIRETLVRMGKDNDTALDMLEQIYKEGSRFAIETRKDAITDLRRLADDIAESVKKTRQKADARVAHTRARLQRIGEGEERIPGIPAFQGKILKTPRKVFTGPTANETAQTIAKTLQQQLPNNFLKGINQVNALGRFFVLAGDMSPLTIQLLYLMGSDPVVFGRAAEGFVRAFINPRFQSAYLLKNAETIRTSQALNIASAGGLEFTDVLATGGFLRTNRILRVPGHVLEPFQRGMEGALDVAAIEMKKSLSFLATDVRSGILVDEFINNFTGMSNSRRLGVSPRMQQLESLALLAPRYMRASIGLTTSMAQGGLRGSLARDAMARSLTSLVAMNVAISSSLDESYDDIVAHLNPADPKFFTWDVGGTPVGLGGKIRSVIAMAGRVFTAVEEGKEDRVPGIAASWLRGQASPVISGGVDFGLGRDFNGYVTRSDDWPFVSVDTLKTIGAANTMPIWVQSVLLEGKTGDAGDTGTRGGAEFGGLRAREQGFYNFWVERAEEFIGKPIDQFTADDRARAKKEDAIGQENWDNFIKDRDERGRTDEAVFEMNVNRNNYSGRLQSAIDEAKKQAAAAGGEVRFDLLREAFISANAAYHTRNNDIRDDPRYGSFFQKMEDLPPSERSFDLALQEYYGIWADPDLENALTGRDWSAHNLRMEEFKTLYGNNTFERIKTLEEVNRLDLPAEYRLYREETSKLEEYWSIEETLLQEAGEDELLWAYQNIYRDDGVAPKWERDRYATAIGLRPFLNEATSLRREWRATDPTLDGIVRRWYGNAPIEG